MRIFGSNVLIERWKFNKEYGVYVSTFGHFKDRFKREIPLNKRNGYCYCRTEVGIKLAHRLVLLTWKPIPNAEELTVDHKDRNKSNNRIDNLEWVSAEENYQRAINIQREYKKYTFEGKTHHLYKINDEIYTFNQIFEIIKRNSSNKKKEKETEQDFKNRVKYNLDNKKMVFGIVVDSIIEEVD